MDELAQWAVAFGIRLSRDQLDKFVAYEALLLEWNERISLTAIREPRPIRLRHFLDSLTCVVATGPLDDRSLIDVGSGAGFPGLPLKIAYPGLRLALVESTEKKARFLELVTEKLGLAGVTVIADRAEAMGHAPDYRERYDWAVARAVADLRVLAELCLPLVRVGGAMLAQKGQSAATEVAAAATAIATLGGGEAILSSITLPESEQPHYLVTIPKIEPTDARYPRRIGVPAKRPL